MTSQHLLRDATYLNSLAEHLSACPEVTRFDTGEEKEAWTLAHAFADLEASFEKVLHEQLPRLTNGKLPPSETYALLLEIGEELRHILYHVRDPQFYRYLDDRAADATVRLREETLPPRDPAHGTPDAVVRRKLEFELPQGTARWEQTDYGHPGRFNPWDPRGIDAKLQPKTAQLRAVAEALSALLSEPTT